MATIIISSDVPTYRVLDPHGFYAEDLLVEMGGIIEWTGGLNPQLEPMNEPARKALSAYLDGLDKLGMAQAAKNGVAYIGTPRTDGAIAMATIDSRKPQLVPGGPGVPLMGGQPRGPKQLRRVSEDTTEQVIHRPGARRAQESA